MCFRPDDSFRAQPTPWNLRLKPRNHRPRCRRTRMQNRAAKAHECISFPTSKPTRLLSRLVKTEPSAKKRNSVVVSVDWILRSLATDVAGSEVEPVSSSSTETVRPRENLQDLRRYELPTSPALPISQRSSPPVRIEKPRRNLADSRPAVVPEKCISVFTFETPPGRRFCCFS